MYEEIGELLGEGFRTWRRNLNLCAPFLISMAFMVLAMIPPFIGLVYILGSDFSTSAELVARIERSPLGLALIVALFVLLVTVVNSFFASGAIAMAREATDKGKTSIGTMWSGGRRHFLSMLLVSIMMGCLMLAGLILLLPGLYLLPWPPSLEDPRALSLLLAGALLFILYALALSLLLAVAPYALVVDGLGPVQALKVGLDFFMKNKFDVFMVWIVVIAISLGLQMLGGTAAAESVSLNALISGLTGLINLVILAPLSTVWWTRLYMSRSGKLPREDPWRA